MSMPYWRYVEYLDDGVERYQCLNCKGFFCTVHAPGHTVFNDEGTMPLIYETRWAYCPLCGVKWTGNHLGFPHPRNEKSYGERRFRAYMAMKDRYLSPDDASHWSIEYQSSSGYWHKTSRICLFDTDTREILGLLKHYRARDNCPYRARIVSVPSK